MRYNKKQKGFTLTELLVGATIGMIGCVIIFQVLRNSQGIVENVSGGNDATQNGAIAAYMIERSARLSGFGINQQDLMDCNILGTKVVEGASAPLASIRLSPIEITQGTQDSIRITNAADNTSYIAPSKLTEAYPGDETNLKVSNRFGFQNGGLILLTDGSTCTLRQIQSLPSGGASDNIVHTPGVYVDQYGTNRPIQYNKSGGEGVVYPINTKIYNIGGTPASTTYSIIGNNLVATNGFTGDSTIIAPDIVDIQAVYGRNNAGTIVWETTTPASYTEYINLAAIKFAVLSRSNAKSTQKDISNNCTTTTTVPSWSEGVFDVETNVGSDWSCYRYKVFESTASLKNMVWRPQ